MDIVGHQGEQEIKITDVHEMIVNTGNLISLVGLPLIHTVIDAPTREKLLG